jgi:hypothetical protein
MGRKAKRENKNGDIFMKLATLILALPQAAWVSAGITRRKADAPVLCCVRDRGYTAVS